MLIGHAAVAFAGKRIAPRVSLGWSLFAAYFPDLLWPILLLAGVEEARISPGATAFMPVDFVSGHVSHTLAGSIAFGAAIGGAHFMLHRSKIAFAWLWTATVSHWLLDALTHRHGELPLWPGGPQVGLELWASVPGTLAVEGALAAAGIFLYARATRPRDAIGHRGFYALVAFLIATWLSTPFGPPPPSVTVLAWLVMSTWLLPLAGALVDRHREVSS